jgi:hypothetical protein
MTDTKSLPTGGPTREEIAKIEIGHTNVSPAIARALLAFFVLTIFALPVIESMTAAPASNGAAQTAWTRLTDLPQQAASAVADEVARGVSSRWRQIVAANNAIITGLIAFEDAIEDESRLGRTLRPPAQRLLTQFGRAGNEQVYVGREVNGVRWLFYRQDVDYLTNRGFLDNQVMRQRTAVTSPPSPIPAVDPRPAILAFSRALASRGIRLILMPTPVKPGVHPEKLRGGDAQAEVVQNPSYHELVRDLLGQGVLIFDPSEVLDSTRHSEPQFLATDTHWTPSAMQRVAEALGTFINHHVDLPTVPRPSYEVEQRRVENFGDSVVMLDLPPGQQLFPRETTSIRRVIEADGENWRPHRDADIMVLGDSFSNIYSVAAMGFGESGGFVEQLSYTLRRPVDRIVQNGDAAFATRIALHAAGPERLDSKRVVIWQFAVRELAFGDWKMIP